MLKYGNQLNDPYQEASIVNQEESSNINIDGKEEITVIRNVA